jgi:hypothetical protein
LLQVNLGATFWQVLLFSSTCTTYTFGEVRMHNFHIS